MALSACVRPALYSSERLIERMETVKRDLHQSTAHCSALLTRYSKLAASASSSYSASGLVKDDLAQRRHELEDELKAAFDTVSRV